MKIIVENTRLHTISILLGVIRFFIVIIFHHLLSYSMLFFLYFVGCQWNKSLFIFHFHGGHEYGKNKMKKMKKKRIRLVGNQNKRYRGAVVKVIIFKWMTKVKKKIKWNKRRKSEEVCMLFASLGGYWFLEWVNESKRFSIFFDRKMWDGNFDVIMVKRKRKRFWQSHILNSSSFFLVLHNDLILIWFEPVI